MRKYSKIPEFQGQVKLHDVTLERVSYYMYLQIFVSDEYDFAWERVCITRLGELFTYCCPSCCLTASTAFVDLLANVGSSCRPLVPWKKFIVSASKARLWRATSHVSSMRTGKNCGLLFTAIDLYKLQLRTGHAALSSLL